MLLFSLRKVVLCFFLTIVCLFYLLHCGSGVFAECYPRLKPHNNLMMAYKDFGDRHEGFYSAYVSAVSMSVASCTVGAFRFEMAADEIVSIHLPFHSGLEACIHAKALNLKTYYRMDACLKAGDVLKWPIGDRIYACDRTLTCDKLGVYAWIKPEKGFMDEKVILPVRTQSGKKPSANDGKVRLVVHFTQDIDMRNFRCTRIIKDKKGIDQERPLIVLAIDPGSPIHQLGPLTWRNELERHNDNYQPGDLIVLKMDPCTTICRKGAPIPMILPSQWQGRMRLMVEVTDHDTQGPVMGSISLDLGNR